MIFPLNMVIVHRFLYVYQSIYPTLCIQLGLGNLEDQSHWKGLELGDLFKSLGILEGEAALLQDG